MSVLLFAVFLLLFTAAVWKIASVELRIRMIPAADLRRDAQVLIRQCGTRARAEAARQGVRAMNRFDMLAAGRWDRISQVIENLEMDGVSKES